MFKAIYNYKWAPTLINDCYDVLNELQSRKLEEKILLTNPEVGEIALLSEATVMKDHGGQYSQR